MIELMLRLQGLNQPQVVAAISGGVDSCVLLDLLIQEFKGEVIVAHFNHQIRGAESDADAVFVRNLAKKYNLKYEIVDGGLGPAASEETARQARYAFLRQVAANYQAPIVTAHHLDDVVESIAINLTRGTGWRGLAVMQAPDLVRPLISYTKNELLAYAAEHDLTWQEDLTNVDPKYLRNQIRQRINDRLDETYKRLIFDLWRQQVDLKSQIDQEVKRFLPTDHRLSRYFLIMLDQLSAVEIIRAWVERESGYRPTIPQAERIWWQIKTAQPGDIFELNQQIQLKFHLKYLVVINHK